MAAADRQGDGDWRAIATAPRDVAIALAVIDRDGVHALVFACRRTLAGWVNDETGQRVEVSPTHWRPWRDGQGAGA
jgi:hypothetical protein